MDRLAFEFFKPLERMHERALRQKPGIPSPETIERLILISSKALGQQIQYNRSRLRICRAWALNGLLTTFAFAAWNLRVAAVAPPLCIILVASGLVVSVMIGWVAFAISRDHYNNLSQSYRFLTDESVRDRCSPPSLQGTGLVDNSCAPNGIQTDAQEDARG
jgi:hypothetical protein